MSHASNRAYLQRLVDQIKPIPREAAIRVAWNIYLEMIAISTNDDAGFDSGQAAANWHIEGYFGSPNYSPLKLMWGFGDSAPIAPVGYKSYFPGMVGETGPTGDRDQVYEYMFTQGTMAIASMPSGITGVTVYNPISPGAQGFNPGEDLRYEENALGENKAAMSSVVQKGLAKGLAEVHAMFPFLGKSK